MDIVPGHGNRKAKIAVVGEAPATTECRLGYPFAGKAGDELNRIVGSVGLSRERDLYITNASLEPVRGDKREFFFEGSGKPTQVFLRGLAALMADLNEIRPNVVVPMGNYALWALRQHMDIMKWRGSILHSQVFNVKCIPTIHPAALLWSTPGEEDTGSGLYKYRPVIIWDFERILAESRYPDLRLTPRTLLVEPSGAAREEALERLRNAKRLTFDCEAPRNRIGLKCISFSDFDPNWAVCFWNRGTESLALFSSLLENDIPKVGQNLMYDATLLDQLGIQVGNVQHDTMLCQHVLYTDLPKGLDFMASIYTDIPYYKEEGKEHGDKEDPHQLMAYCCKDNCATTETTIHQEEHLATDPNLAATFNRSMRVFDPLRQITRRGIAVNQAVLAELMAEAQEKRAKYQKLVNEEAGYEVNVMSSPQMRHLIYEEKNLAPGRTVQTTRAPVLMSIAATTQDPFLVNVIRTRQARKLLSSYLNYDILSPDGRLRWEYKIAGTKTGRLSCQAPSWGPGVNGQTFPPKVRRIMESDDGWEFCEIDGMQAESVMTAVYAQDPVHLDCFRTGKDVHRVTACLLMDRDPETWKEIPKGAKIRQLGKTCNHAFDYDMGPVTFMYTVNEDWDPDDPESLRIDQRTATQLRDKYLSLRPALRGYWEWVRAELRKNLLTLVNPFGRTRLFLDKWSDTMFKDAYSWLPQGTVGDYTNIGIIQIGRKLRQMGIPHFLVAQTHDSSTWSYPKECRGEVVPTLLSYGEVPLFVNGMLFTIPVEAAVGDSLYKLKPGDPEDWKGLKGAGESRKTIDLGAEEYQRMLDRMNEALQA